MTSEELLEAISAVVQELVDMDADLFALRQSIDTNQLKHHALLRDLIEEIKHLRYAVDRVGR